MIYLVLTQLLVFVAYVAFIISRYGVIHSISQSWYELPQRQKPLFTWFTWGIGIPFLFYDNALFFLAGAGLTFVGVATAFRTTQSYTNIVHYTGAAMGILLSLLGLGFVYNDWISLSLFLISALTLRTLLKNHWIWWVEIAAFIIIIVSLLLYI